MRSFFLFFGFVYLNLSALSQGKPGVDRVNWDDQFIIVDKNGRTLKDINLSGSGTGSLTVDASTLASGAYHYSLFVDGKLIATKQMILTK